MSESFNKFKKKILKEVLIKIISLSLSIGLIAFSIPFLYSKITKIELQIIYIILIAVLLTLLSFGILFLIYKFHIIFNFP